MSSRLRAGSDDAPQSIRKLTRSPRTWKQVFPRPPEPNASPQPTNCRCIARDGLAAARRAEQPRQQPDRDPDDRAKQEIPPQPVDGVEAEIPQPLEQQADAVDDVPGIESDGC